MPRSSTPSLQPWLKHQKLYIFTQQISLFLRKVRFANVLGRWPSWFQQARGNQNLASHKNFGHMAFTCMWKNKNLFFYCDKNQPYCLWDLRLFHCTVMLKSLRPPIKIWIFTTSLEDCLICFVTLVLMLEEHCYITDASITTFRSELFNNLVILEARKFEIMASFFCWKYEKKGCCQVWTGQKLLFCMKRGTQKF